MKTTAYLFIVLALAFAAPVFAQGAFSDVPQEHWAYDAVDQLQKDGLIQGYPDGTFQGKRTMSRYEFAMVIARVLPLIQRPMPGPGPEPTAGVTNQQLQQELSKYALKSDIPTNVATKDDVAAVRKLVDGFQDELSALGVDVDQVKKDLAALEMRVTKIEEELKRVRFTGAYNFIVKAVADNTNAVDFPGLTGIDGRIAQTSTVNPSAPLRDVNTYNDFDLRIAGRVTDNTDVISVINYGNYLNYVNGISTITASAADMFTPYYVYANSDLGFGKVTFGRFPLQLTPYTFKMVDPDVYTMLDKTDSGNRQVEGGMLKMGLLGIDWTLFAVQHNNVQPISLVPFNQSAGVMAGINIPYSGRLGLTYYQGWNKGNYKTAFPDVMNVYGADLALPLPFLKTVDFSASWAQSDLYGPAGKLTIDNQVLAGKLEGKFAGISLGAGYKWIGKDYSAPGYWDRIGRMFNPTNVKGFTIDAGYSFSDRIGLNVAAELLEPKNNGAVWGNSTLLTDDKVNSIKGGVSYAYSKTDAVGLDVEWINFDLAATPATADDPTEAYYTINWMKKIGDNGNFKVGYQFVNFDSGGSPATAPYGRDYKGGIGVVQMGVSF